ncbi:AsmA-like C-terminal region-containing protein [Arthrospiribacter ruber]|uniref:AsmA-like C-terminal domain-containing protein n=1 Tax=Arthrospiribacter ruber TaxID=2487934 RepID=A0A951ME59_9BACT|nr:AsmA-like C-terminal region-containing protein [Arthrospiribacter ruber]MBW3467661.1 hypothetical protein [Arthrospiribacter ruber]
MKKKILIGFAIFFLILGILAALPFIFKDKIAERIDREIQGAVNAQVYYDFNNISLSIFRRFPHISATVREFGIIGNPPFQNDTLVHVDRLQVDFNLRSVIFDDFPTLTGLHLNGGSLYVKVLEDGKANYDITFPSEEPATESNFKMAVDIIEVNDLDVIYDDRELDFFMALGQIDMVGRGDFTMDVYDLPMEMEAIIADVSFDGTNYLRNKKFKGETVLNVDLEQMKFTLGDGSFRLNDFLFDLKGYLALPEEDIEMDLAFEGKNNTFKSILSLVPGVYTENFDNLRTSGTMDFRGFMKGIYNENSFPSFDISLKVEDGMFQYPDLPRPVSNINVAMHVENSSNDLDNTRIEIPNFSMDFGSNPISGRFALANLKDYTMDGSLRGKLNLEELTSIFPVEGITLRGMLDVDATAKGRYDSVAQVIPSMDARLALTNGFVKSSDYPAPIEKLNVNATVSNPSGRMDDFIVNLSQFGFELENESITGRLRVQDFAALNWDGALQGGVDLGKMLAIFPMENIIMEGKLKADLQSKGSYADVEAARYNRIDMRGELDLREFYFNSTDVPQGIRINTSTMEFSPQRITLKDFDSRLGQSPLTATGFLSNYMDYFLKNDAVLTGQLSLNSSKFDINEWMTADTSEESMELSVVELPKDIDFTMAINMQEVIYDNLSLKNVRGNLGIKDGILRFRDAAMSTLGGQISMNGTYDPRNITEPVFAFDLDLSSLSIPRAFESFNTVRAFAPIAQHLTGNFSTKLNFSGQLGPDMMPVLSTLDGKGLLRVAEASYQNPQLLQAVSQVTRLNESNSLQFRNISIPVEINNGVMDVRPFDVRLWDYQANIQGSTSFDGSINYLLNMQVPAGRFGSMANNILSTISGTQASESTIIPLALNLGGTYSNPRVSLAGGNSIENMLANALRSRVTQERENIQEQVTQQFRAAEDSLKREVRAKAETLQDSVRREAERKASETKDRAVEEAKSVLRNVLRPPRQNTRPDTTSNP